MGNFESTNGKSIDIAFAQFNKKNPLVFKTFESEVFKAIRIGRTKISAKQLIGHIRWYVGLKTTDEKFKINDAFTSRYARLFAKKYPKWQHIFEYRILKTGSETIKKELLNKQQLLILKRAHQGYIVKIGNSIHIHWNKNKQQPLDRQTFNYLLQIQMLQKTTGTSRIEKWKPAQKAKNILKMAFPPKKQAEGCTKPIAPNVF